MCVFPSLPTGCPPATALSPRRWAAASWCHQRGAGPLQAAAELPAPQPAARSAGEAGRRPAGPRGTVGPVTPAAGNGLARRPTSFPDSGEPERPPGEGRSGSAAASPEGSESASAGRPRGRLGAEPRYHPSPPPLGPAAGYSPPRKVPRTRHFFLCRLRKLQRDRSILRARPPLASPRRRKGRWQQRHRPRCPAARPPGNNARAPLVPAMAEEEEAAAVLAWMDQALDVVSAGGGGAPAGPRA